MKTTPIGLPTSDVLRYCETFSKLQQGLVELWRELNPNARDLETLLDFQKQSTLNLDGVRWIAKKHGIGVRFESENGIVVDIPWGIGQPTKFDPDRVYDYLTTIKAIELPPSTRHRRVDLYRTFDMFEANGFIQANQDRSGRKLYQLTNNSVSV